MSRCQTTNCESIQLTVTCTLARLFYGDFLFAMRLSLRTNGKWCRRFYSSPLTDVDAAGYSVAYTKSMLACEKRKTTPEVIRFRMFRMLRWESCLARCFSFHLLHLHSLRPQCIILLFVFSFFFVGKLNEQLPSHSAAVGQEQKQKQKTAKTITILGTTCSVAADFG